MAYRHNCAVQALQTNDLRELARLLAAAVQDSLDHFGMPHMDMAVRLICHHISFAGNGDLPLNDQWQKMVDECIRVVNEGPNATFIQQGTKDDPSLYKAN